MPFMYKEASNAPRTSVEVLVRTPGSHIHAPVMEVQLNVASSMGQVKTNIATLKEEGEGEYMAMICMKVHLKSQS